MTTAEAFAQDLIDHEESEVIADSTDITDPAERALRSSGEKLETLTDNGIVRVLRTAASQIARLEAVQVRAAAVLARRRAPGSDTTAELAMALCLTDNDAGALVAAAEALTSRWPKTFDLMERGQLNLFRAMQVTDVTAWLSDEAAQVADAKLAPRLPGKNHAQVRRAAAYAARQADPGGDERRAEQRRESRTFSLKRQKSGTATLTLDGAPAEKAVAAYSQVDRIATSLKTQEEPRTLNQLRADVALDLLLSADHRWCSAADRGVPAPRVGHQSGAEPSAAAPGGTRPDPGRAGGRGRRRARHRAGADPHRSAHRAGARSGPDSLSAHGGDPGVRAGAEPDLPPPGLHSSR